MATFENDPSEEQNATAEKIEQNPVLRVKACDAREVSGDSFRRMCFPTQCSHKEEQNSKHPEHRHGTVGVELRKTVDYEYLPPRVLEEISPLPVDQEHLCVELVHLVNDDTNEPEQSSGTHHDVECNVKGRILRHECHYRCGGFSEEEPVTCDNQQEIEHPQ